MIYCVEDDSGIRELVVYSLENTGFSAKGFENGKQFFDGLDESSLPDMVLLDIMLPGEDGVSILKKLRANPKTRNLPVILLTAKDSEYDKVIGLRQRRRRLCCKTVWNYGVNLRIKAVLRRCGHEGTVSDDCVYNIGCITLNTKKALC